MSTTKRTPPSPSLAIKASDLRDLVAPVLPFVSKDRWMADVIAGVHIESEDGHLIATTTDRYRVALCRRPFDVSDGLDVVISAADLKDVLNTFKVTKARDPEITVTFGQTPIAAEQQMIVEGETGITWRGKASTARLVYPAVEGKFPNVRHIFTQDFVDVPGAIGLNPTYLQDFKHAVGRNEPIHVRISNPKKPVIITAGEHFLGAVMPVRLDGDSDGKPVPVIKPGWATYLQKETTK